MMLVVSMIKAGNYYSKKTAKEVIDILVNYAFDLDEFRMNFSSLDRCRATSNRVVQEFIIDCLPSTWT